MESPGRPIAFVLASTDHGTMILNRNDVAGDEARRFGVGFEILSSGVFCADEIDLTFKLLDARRNAYGDGVVAIDCGANIGVHSVEWSRWMAGWGSVVAIEAQERIYYALAGNIAINNCFNIQALHAAAGDFDGTMKVPTLNHLQPASFGSLELKKLARSEDIGQVVSYADEHMALVHCIRLDSLGLRRVDLIKIDVEGMEIEVLGGAKEVISRCSPLLFVEHHKSDRPAMERLLGSWGYVIYDTGGMNLLAVHAADKTRDSIARSAGAR